MGKCLSKRITYQANRSTSLVSLTTINSTRKTVRPTSVTTNFIRQPTSVASQGSLALCLEGCTKGELTLVEAYLKTGGDVNCKKVIDGTDRNPLLTACCHGHVQIIKLLHEYGAQVDLQNNQGWTALMQASQNGRCEVVRLLHEYGAQVDLQNNGGWSALMAASADGHCEVVKLLHEYGAHVDLQNNDGLSALMAASYCGHFEVVKLLLQYGAQVDLQKNDGWSALMAASVDGHCEVVKLLLQYGAQVDLQHNGALMIASQNGHSETVEILQSIMHNSATEERDQPQARTIINVSSCMLDNNSL